jgi:ADP-ribose pyrophosphatase YjhB (NUDIX family)
MNKLHDTHVVTSFLQRTDGPEFLILIVKRSQRVGSYQASWAGISGFVEPGVSPEEQAYTEIREETGLQAEQVRLLKYGNVVEVDNPEVNRHFIVHPFLFEVLAPDTIKTDWEAVEMRWIKPDEINNYQTVPKLLEAYQSALQGASF